MTSAFETDLSPLDTAPPQWDRRPLWTLLQRRDVTGMPAAELLSVYRDHGVVPKSSREDNFNKPSEDLSTYRYVRPGDLVLNKMKTWQGSLAVSDYEGIVSPAYYVCEISSDVHARFAHYLLRSTPYIHLYQAASKGIRPNQWDLPFDEFRSLPMLLPPLEEQRRIADFLDAEISRIDHLVNLQRQVLVRLEERDTAILDAELDRLAGEAGVLPFRRYVVGVDQGTSPQCEAIPATEEEWGVLKVSCLRPGEFFPDENKRLPEGLTPNVRHEVQQGDLLITRANTPQLVGATAVVPPIRGKLLLSDKIFRVRVLPTLDPHYVTAVARGSRIRNLCSAASNGASQSMANIRFEEVKEWPIPAISIDRQRDLVSRMSRTWDMTRDLRVKVQSQLSLLTERKQALITAAVTGQIDVSTASGRGIED